VLRKLLAFLFLVVLAVGVWWSARWIRHRNDLHATLVFDQPTTLERGNEIVSGQLVIGRVTKVAELDGQQAVSIRVEREQRNELLTDSIFDVEGTAPNARLRVTNSIAVGPPVADGSIMRPKDSKVTRWLAAHSAAVAPAFARLKDKADQMVSTYDYDKIKDEVASWEEKLPEWKREGKDSVDRNVAALKVRVSEMEQQLRKAKKNVEADRLRHEFNSWLDKVRED
jgi:hypothetical protein